MRKTFGMNRHQKAAHKRGELRVSRAQIPELLALSRSSDAEDRLIAAQFLCPCHVRGRIPEVWDALFRMMEDTDERVRLRAWHTLEDGGLPPDPAAMDLLERIFNQESDPKVRHFAWQILGKELTARQKREEARLNLAGRSARRQRGKCDFCGERDVFVERDLDTTIPTDGQARAAWICDRCAQGA
jgi:hypothetical protein